MSEQINGGTSATDALDAAIGTGVVAALADDGPGKPEDIAARPPNCLNCGTVVRGRYCIDCGQVTDTHVPTLAEVLGDAITSIFNLDSRLWRTVGTLFFAPGRLTQDFLAGKRARYVPPLRLYLVMSVLLFLLTSLDPTDNDEEEFNAQGEAISQEVEDEIEDAIEAGAQLDTDPDPDLDLSQGVDVEFGDDGNLTIRDAEGNLVEGGDVKDADDCDEMSLPFPRGGAVDSAIRETCTRGAEDDFAAMTEAFTDNIPLLAFMVIPVMAVVFKVFYVFTGRNYLAHLVFLCHTHAFTFMLIVVLTVMRMLGRTVPGLGTLMAIIGGLLFLVYMPAYYFLALRRVYEQGVLLTLSKQFALMAIYFFAVLIVFSVGFLIAALVA